MNSNTTDFWTVENGQLALYRRSGQCNQCTECCCTHEITYQLEVGFNSGKRDDENEENYDWSHREGWHIFLAQGIWWYVNIVSIERREKDKPCSALVNGKCSIWDTNDFTPLCRYWPFHPGNIEQFSRCGFSFEKVREDKV
jgi:hypothetical protein